MSLYSEKEGERKKEDAHHHRELRIHLCNSI